jgi:RimJ/RimL family protein N-acetyltransferase
MAEAQEVTDALYRWQRDSEYQRLDTSESTTLSSRQALQNWVDDNLYNLKADHLFLTVHRLEDGRLIGFVELEDLSPTLSEAFVGIGVGERELWGHGYGTDAMRVLMRYAFTELNLKRLALTVFEYNPRAIRSYEKAGFRREGRLRQFVRRDGRRWDLLYMGILREEWVQLYGAEMTGREAV